ncbi:thioesterase [Catellatospora sp. IY07-71]|uniref:thioesterase II family protein n=1 Tax=Catellatospora sp. IY07-71 TaxID=2728827 RepID=UPI001BB3A515|nr:alpha/beta fold hydrolase [Catellatospora sp. IY07-71]BCJ73661.1 thioesterase [Catellatospora sp. IY07-71]
MNSLRRHRTTARPRLRIVCFPHVGGAASFFRTWPAGLPGDVDVLAAQYPGHEDRIAEPFADDLSGLAAELADALIPLLDVPTLLFGHSMGATVAYEAARRIEALVPRARIALAVSASAAPDAPRQGPADDGDDALVAHLRELGGVPPEVLADPELRELVLPVVRHDYAMLHRHRDDPQPRLRSPIMAFCGQDDALAGPSQMRRWDTRTAGRFTLKIFTGGHFYLVPHQNELLKELTAWPPAAA